MLRYVVKFILTSSLGHLMSPRSSATNNNVYLHAEDIILLDIWGSVKHGCDPFDGRPYEILFFT